MRSDLLHVITARSNIIPFPCRPVTRPLAAPFAFWQLWLGIGLLIFAAFCTPGAKAE
jgi:hypothetical protein